MKVPSTKWETLCLLLLILLILLGSFNPPLTAEETSSVQALPKLVKSGQRVFLPTEKAGRQMRAFVQYTHPTGTELFCQYMYQTRSDIFDAAFQMYSEDNGRTWSEPTALPTFKKLKEGTLRIRQRPGFVDPDRDVLIVLRGEKLLPSDNPLEAMHAKGSTTYKLSRDGGRTFYHEAPLIHVGGEFNQDHPLPGVWSGKNSVQVGDLTCAAIKIKSGEILQPVQITPLGPDGKYYKPGRGYTYHDAAVLIANWNEKGTLDWRVSERVVADPKRSTRGMIEPTIIQLPDDRILMVMRGSNDVRKDLNSWRWYSVSEDNGRTWIEPEPWTYSNGESFFSPSACSHLIKHSSGHIFWIGNITPHNPRGNLPRYPLVIGLVDPKSLGLVKETVLEIDTRQPEDHPQMTLSNFHTREDRETGEIVILVPTIGRHHPLSKNNLKARREWTSDNTEYRIKVVEAEQ